MKRDSAGLFSNVGCFLPVDPMTGKTLVPNIDAEERTLSETMLTSPEDAIVDVPPIPTTTPAEEKRIAVREKSEYSRGGDEERVIRSSNIVLFARLLDSNGKLPSRATPGSAGYDLYSAESVEIPRGTTRAVKTSVALEIPVGYCGKICSRSSHSLERSVEVGAGIIDSDYRGEIKVILHTLGNGDQSYAIRIGDRIAQLVLMPVIMPEMIEVKELCPSTRGLGGFGSTGEN